MITLLIISWVVLFTASCLAFDKLLRFQYTWFRKSWETDGRPFGIFWKPPEVMRSGFWAFIASSSAHKRARFDWVFVTPIWVRQRAEARAWLYAYRITIVVTLLMPLWAVLLLEYLG